MNEPFFIGWAKPPEGLRGFLVIAGVLFVTVFALSAYLASATQADPGDGAFRWDWGRQTLTGRLTTAPYPHLTLTDGSAHFSAGDTLILGGPGKRGVIDRAAPFDGQLVRASGIILTRGDLAMLQVRGAPDGLRPVGAEAGTDGDAADAADDAEAGPAPEPVVVDLGRWRLTGEICDGKCYVGAMRPGTGVAHKACANLCIAGGQPPVFVATAPVDGALFFLMGDADGTALPDRLYDFTGARVAIEGRVERRDSLPVFLVDADTVRHAR